MKENLLDKYLTHHAKNQSYTSYFCNVLNNNKNFGEKLDKNHPDCLIRSHNDYCNLTVIDWMDYGRGFKGYDSRRWYYVIENSCEDDTVQIRKDLIDKWQENNAKNNVLILNTNKNKVWDIPMQMFFGFQPLPSKVTWNNEGNVVLKFDLPKNPTFTDNKPEEIDSIENVNHLTEIWGYIGNVSYAKHRIHRNQMYLVAAYNKDGTLKSYHKMKSISQIYDLLGFSNVGSLRTFQRLMDTEKISIFATNLYGTTFWISKDTSIQPPKTSFEDDTAIVSSTVEINENQEILITNELETVSISIDDLVSECLRNDNDMENCIYEKAIEKATEIINDSEVKRIINRPEPLKIGTVNDTGYDDWLRMVDEMNVKPKRIIIRG